MVQTTSVRTLELISPRAALLPCILDDDPAQLELMTELVAGAGYEAVATSDPEEALQLVRSGQSRMILADVRMPGCNGYEFLERAIKTDPGAHVILMTGDYTLESAVDAIRRGAADFLPKPVDRARLKRMLDDTAVLYDQRRRVKALEEQLLKDLEFHGTSGKAR
jgi:DNA-binding NtrC family response regulator